MFTNWIPAGIFDDLAKCPHCGAVKLTMTQVCEDDFKFCPFCGKKVEGEVCRA